MRRPKLEFLTADDVQQIIGAAYDLLETFGVRFDNEEALRILAEAGASVGFEERVTYLPPVMVEQALESAPSSCSIYDQSCMAFYARSKGVERPPDVMGGWVG